MSLVNFFASLIIVIGVLFIIVGIKHHNSWLWGIMLVVAGLIVKSYLWLTSMF